MKILMAAQKEKVTAFHLNGSWLGPFVREQPDMELFDIYIDDGYSGANFDPPDFKRMMADIEAGKRPFRLFVCVLLQSQIIMTV